MGMKDDVRDGSTEAVLEGPQECGMCHKTFRGKIAVKKAGKLGLLHNGDGERYMWYCNTCWSVCPPSNGDNRSTADHAGDASRDCGETGSLSQTCGACHKTIAGRIALKRG